MASQAPAARFSFGQTVQDMFSVIGQNFMLMAAIALLLYGVPSAALSVLFIDSIAGFADPSGFSSVATLLDFGIWALVATGIGTIFSVLTQAALIGTALRGLAGRTPSFASAMSDAIGFFLPVLAILIIYYLAAGLIVGLPMLAIFGGAFAAADSSAGLGAIFGAVALFLLVLVPVLLFMVTVWLVAVPAAISERINPIAALGRSWQLTSGHRWKLVAMIIIFVIVVMMISGAFSAMSMPFASFDSGGFSTTGLYISTGVQTLLSSLTLVLTYPAIAATYTNLRMAKEGVRPDSVADIFE